MTGCPRADTSISTPPSAAPTDVRWVKLADLNGDAKAEVLVRYLERAANGRREVVAVYRYDSSGRFGRSFAQEVLKARGSRTLSNRLRAGTRVGATKAGASPDTTSSWTSPPQTGSTATTSSRTPATTSFPSCSPGANSSAAAVPLRSRRILPEVTTPTARAARSKIVVSDRSYRHVALTRQPWKTCPQCLSPLLLCGSG